MPMSILAIIACVACAVKARIFAGMFCTFIAGGFCVNMNGFIPVIGETPGAGSGCDGIVSGGIGIELLLAVGGGLRAVMDISSA